MLTYGKLAGETPRMLVLESQYWLDAACMNAARALGWEWTSAPVLMVGYLPRADMERLLRTLVEFRPDFVLNINLSGMDVGGLFAQLLGDLGIPLVTWFVDDPRTILMGRTAYATPFSLALTWDAAYTEYLQAC
ncbi:MAG: spore maturation protein CgeB, partial [Candidatus Hydrogenedentes bacterium]|nr:spore maturation protein CgeB [Candidatus Hydrogenedentota bacterium]